MTEKYLMPDIKTQEEKLYAETAKLDIEMYSSRNIELHDEPLEI